MTDMLVWRLRRYEAQPLTEEVLLKEQQRAEEMLQAASAGVPPAAQLLPSASNALTSGATP